MGFFSNLKAGIEAAQAAAAAQEVADVPAFLDPVPQEEVDRLLAGTGTVRAIVYSKSHQVLQPGERVGRMTVKLKVRPRGAAGGLGDLVELKASISSLTASLIARGLDVPVERDPATGALTKVASKQLTDELAHRADEAEKLNPHVGLDPDVEGMIDVAKAIGKAVTGGPADPQSAADARGTRRRGL